MSLLHDPTPSLAATGGFLACTAFVSVAAVLAFGAVAGGSSDDARAWRRRSAAALAAWLLATGAAAWSGVLADFESLPPPMMVLAAASGLASTLFAFSRLGTRLAEGLPLAALVGFHAFRLPLEIVLHRLSIDRVLPVQMTWDGMNYDVATGVTAIAVAAWAAWGSPPRVVLLAWNALGTLLLWVIITIAILSTPFPLRAFWNEPANTIIATLPYVWLPTVLVQAAWIGHLLLFRRLLRAPST